MYNKGMLSFETKYDILLYQFRNEVIDHEEERKRWLTQLRHQMIANAQISKELDEARELIDTLLYGDNPKDKSPYIV